MLVVSLLLQLAVLSLVLRPKTNSVAAEPAAASDQSVNIYQRENVICRDLVLCSESENKIEFIFSSVVADDPANAGNQTIDDYFSVMSDLNLSSSEKMNLAV